MLFKFSKKTGESIPSEIESAVPSDVTTAEARPTLVPTEYDKRANELDRRESVLNARLAAFEAAQRRAAEMNGSGVRNPNGAAIDVETVDKNLLELQTIAEKLEARERKIAELAASLRERETALAQRRRTLDAQERELEKKRAEAESLGLRLVAARQEIDEKERLFEERSQRTLETIRLQAQSLHELRKAA